MKSLSLKYHEIAHKLAEEYRYHNYYTISFSSVKSCLSYEVTLNLRSGHYEIESYTGAVVYEGYIHTDFRDCNDNELNNYAYNIIRNYFGLSWSKLVPRKPIKL